MIRGLRKPFLLRVKRLFGSKNITRKTMPFGGKIDIVWTEHAIKSDRNGTQLYLLITVNIQE